MAYAGNQTVMVDIAISYSGQTGHMTLEFGTENVGEYASPSAIADVLETQFADALRDCLSNQALLVGFTVSTTAPTGVPPFPAVFREIAQYGTITSQPLPPHVCARIYKIPDPTTHEGALTTPFRVGMVRLMGVPEQHQDAGILDSTYVALLNTFGETIEDFEVDYGVWSDIPYELIMVRRDSSSGDFAIEAVQETDAGAILGSQNSRKITP